MKVINRDMYRCDICGTEYALKEDAIACEAAGKMFEANIGIQNHMWYEISLSDKDECVLGFVIKTNAFGCSRSCRHKCIEVQTLNGNYDVKSGLYHIGNAYTIEDAYEKFGVIPDERAKKLHPKLSERISALEEKQIRKNIELLSDSNLDQIYFDLNNTIYRQKNVSLLEFMKTVVLRRKSNEDNNLV